MTEMHALLGAVVVEFPASCPQYQKREILFATATSSQRAPRERPESSLVAPNEQSILGISIVYIHTYSLVGPKEPYILGISTAYIHTYSLVALKEPYMLVHTYISS